MMDTNKLTRPAHRLTEVEATSLTARCSICGPATPIISIGGHFRCLTAWRITKRASDAKRRGRPEIQDNRRAYASSWHERNREYLREQLLIKKYNITSEQYDRLLVEQKGVCALCEGPPRGPGSANGRFHVDHVHGTKIVRGLLCGPCNTALALVDGRPEMIERLISYLARADREH